MKKILFAVLIMSLGTAVQAQTKRIAHRSHSGSNQHFTLGGEGNFGLKHGHTTTPSKTKVNNTDTTKKQTGNAKKIPVQKPARRDSIVKPKQANGVENH